VEVTTKSIHHRRTNMELDLYMQTIHRSRYARRRAEEKRRETHPETVGRYFDYFTEQKKRHSDKLAFAVREELEESILGLDIMSDEAGLPASSSQTAIAPIYRPAMEVDHRSVSAECCSSQRRTACS
jgi:hypothetical protein